MPQTDDTPKDGCWQTDAMMEPSKDHRHCGKDM